MLGETHLADLCSNFRVKVIVRVIVSLGMRDVYFSELLLAMPHFIQKVGQEFGDMNPDLVIFVIDLVRVNMLEVYGLVVVTEREIVTSYRRLCGRPGLTTLNEAERASMRVLTTFFCDLMLCVRNSLRYNKGFVQFLCKMALEADVVKMVMKKRSLLGLKGILHFTGLTLYEMVKVTDSEDLFLWYEDVEKVDYMHLDEIFLAESGQHELETFMRGAQARGKIDVWGCDGPDMMTNAMALYVNLSERHERTLQEITWDTDFSSLVY